MDLVSAFYERLALRHRASEMYRIRTTFVRSEWLVCVLAQVCQLANAETDPHTNSPSLLVKHVRLERRLGVYLLWTAP